MKRSVKIAAAVVLAVIFGVVGFIGSIQFLYWRSERKVAAMLSALVPGIPFSEAVTRFGQPTRTITDFEEMRAFNGREQPGAAPESVLYLFVHRGLPYRWVLVFTDRAGQTIRHAEWQSM